MLPIFQPIYNATEVGPTTLKFTKTRMNVTTNVTQATSTPIVTPAVVDANNTGDNMNPVQSTPTPVAVKDAVKDAVADNGNITVDNVTDRSVSNNQTLDNVASSQEETVVKEKGEVGKVENVGNVDQVEGEVGKMDEEEKEEEAKEEEEEPLNLSLADARKKYESMGGGFHP